MIINHSYILETKTLMEKNPSRLLNNMFNAVFTFVNVFFGHPLFTTFMGTITDPKHQTKQTLVMSYVCSVNVFFVYNVCLLEKDIRS